ncbi:putative ubiquinone biosynthesis monooxygenase [Geranomyces variabilis]|nr:putative ubiquinone biosynthesis monooxygenase [Geranomyces variabilis]
MLRFSAGLVAARRISRSPRSRQWHSSNTHAAATAIPTAQATHTCDVCIVGGGIVGTALACALASNPITAQLKTALVEAGDLFTSAGAALQQDNAAPAFSNRVSSLTPRSRRFIDRLGAWTDLADRARPYGIMQVWDGVGNGQIRFTSSPSDPSDPAIAHIVENIRLQSSLVTRLRATKVFNRTAVSNVTEEGGFPLVHLADGSEVRARLLVGADGGNSRVRTYANIESIGWDYGQKGIVATLKVETGSNGNDTAWQRFLPTGPIALLPLDDMHSSLVWTTTPALATRLCALPSASFVDLVNVAVRAAWPDVQFLTSAIGAAGEPPADCGEEARWALDRAASSGYAASTPPRVLGVADGSRGAFPLKLRNSERYVAGRVALIGDAAHTIHPLAGQGLNLGLADAESLANVIAEGIEVGQDIGHIHLLESYATQRYAPTLAMLKSVDGLSRLFGTDAAGVAAVRSLGLNLADAAGPLKRVFMDFAGKA